MASPITPRKLFGLPVELQRVQQNLAAPLEHLSKNPILQGRIIADIVLPALTVVQVDHGLGRAVQGYIVTRNNALTVIVDDISQILGTYDLTKVLPLVSLNPVTITVWAF